MTVETTDNRINYIGDGHSNTFAFNFKVYDEGDIKVYDNGVLTSSSIVVTLNSDQDLSPGGSVYINPAVPSNNTITIQRLTPQTQPVDYKIGDAFPPETHERALDRLTFMSQQNNDEAGRNIRAPVSDPIGTDMQLPDVFTRVGKFLGFDALGQPQAVEGTSGDAILREDLKSGKADLSEWQHETVATYQSPNSFAVVDDTKFHVGRPIKTSEGAYGKVIDVAFSVVTVELFSGSITNAITSVQLGPAADGTGSSIQYYPAKSGETGITNYEYELGDIRRYGAIGDGVTDDTTAIINWVKSAQALGYGHAPKRTYVFEPDGLSVPSGWAFPPIINLENKTVNLTGEIGTVFKKGPSTVTNAACFIVADETTADIKLGPFEVLGTGNPGSNGAVLDGFANIGSSNLTVDISTDRTKRHGHYLTKGATGNKYRIRKVTRCNRNNLGVGLQIEGGTQNIFFIDELKDIGSNALDFNESQASDPFYGTIGTGFNATDNEVFIKVIDGTGISNQTDGGGGSSYDIDDDYYGLNLINNSNNNTFHIGTIKNVRKDVGTISPAADTNAAAVRFMSCIGNTVHIDEVRDVGESSNRYPIRMNQSVQGNTVIIGRVELVGPLLQRSDLSDCYDNSFIIKTGSAQERLSRAGQVVGTDFKFLKTTTDTQDSGTLSGWTTQFGYMLAVANGEFTKTVTSGQVNKKLSQDIRCYADYLIAEFEYISVNTSGDASVGLNDSPFDITTLPAAASWTKRKVLVIKSGDDVMNFAIWGSKGIAPASCSLQMRGLKFYIPDGSRLDSNNQYGRLDGAPMTGTYVIGDYVKQETPVIGNPKGWYCAVSGSPGTWVSEGNL